MSLRIELPPDVERQLREEAARKGQAPEDFARSAVEEKLAAVIDAQVARNQELLVLLRQWRNDPPDLEEAGDYPPGITPLSLREDLC